jgi:predicted RNA-binding protein Jag
MRKTSLALETVPEKVAQWAAQLGLRVEAAFEPSGDEALFPNRVLVKGDDASWLAANKGAAIDALQFLVHEAQGEREDSKLAYLDPQGTRLFRMKELKTMAAFATDKAQELGSFKLSGLTPRERRWVHLTISQVPGLGTESEGIGHIKTLKVFKSA